MVFGRKLVGKLDYLQNFNDYLLKCSVGKLLISCSGSYGPNKLEKKNKQLSKNYVVTFLDYVVTELEESQKLCRDKVLLCHDKAKRRLCRNKVLLCRNKVIVKTLSRQSFIMS